MARKNVVQSFTMLESQLVSADITSQDTSIINLDQVSIRVKWNGTLEGEIRIEALQRKSNDLVQDSDWFELDFGNVILIDGTDDNHQIVFTQMPFTDFRLKFVHTSGSGLLEAKITGKQIGG
jgi:hypothetical protein